MSEYCWMFGEHKGYPCPCGYPTKVDIELMKLRKQLEVAENGIHQVDNWARAYPLDIFPEPDFKRVRELLEAGGITLDSVSASNMRHVIKGVEKIVSDTLAEIERLESNDGDA